MGFDWGEHWGLNRITSAGAPAPGWPGNDGWISGQGCLKRIQSEDGDLVLSWMESGAMRAARWRSDGSHAPGWAVGQVTLPGPSIGCSSSELEFDIETDGAGGLFYTWLTTDVRAGRIDASGAYAPGWPAEGLLVRTPPASRSHLVLAADGSGGVIAGWRGYSVSDPVQPAEAQHLNADGTLGPASTVSVDPGVASRVLALSPARPNPSSGVVSFTLELAEAAQASVTIFDAQGRRVRDLVATATLEAGAHTVPWRLDDSDGRRVAPGVYLARAHAAGRSVVRAVLVLD